MLLELRPGRFCHIDVYQTHAAHPVIFMIHGLGGRGYQWREQIKLLRDHYTLVVPDLLGQGQSASPLSVDSNPYSFSELNQDLQALYDLYSGSENIIMGHSYGGALATFLAMQNRDEIKKLILISPVNCEPFKHVPLVYSLPIPFLNILRRYLDGSFEKLAFYSQDAALLKVEREGRAQNKMDVIRALLKGLATMPLLDIKNLAIPTLIIAGKYDRLMPLMGIEKFYQDLPIRQLVVIEQAGHLAQLECSEEVNSIIENFLCSRTPPPSHS
jgi:pimeloyl-ACP methyl ester carboxylesterase